jgi:hypothetical protein
MLVTLIKNNNFNLLLVFILVYGFVFHFFEKQQVMLILGWVGIAVVLDLAWMVLCASVILIVDVGLLVGNKGS